MSDEEKELARSNTEESELPPEMEQMIDTVPEEHREQIRQMLSVSMSMMTRTSPQAEMVKRMTPENYQQILLNDAEETRLTFKDKSETRRITLISIGIIVAFLIISMIILRDQPQLLKEIIVPLLAFAGGALSGYGFASKKKMTDD